MAARGPPAWLAVNGVIAGTADAGAGVGAAGSTGPAESAFAGWIALAAGVRPVLLVI